MCGNVVMIEQMPILGGYVGTVEQCAITDVATHLSSFCMFNASYHLDGPIHVRWGITTARETAQVAGHAAVALDRNTNFLLANQYYTLAGPMTEMCLLETAVQAVTDCCSGRELKSGVAAAKGVAADKTTGMEARVMAEASMGGCKINRAKANEVLNAIIAKYEADYKVAPAGVTFQECYDPISIKPTDEYLAVYEKAMGTLEDCGLPLKGII